MERSIDIERGGPSIRHVLDTNEPPVAPGRAILQHCAIARHDVNGDAP
jgi:hypothetical protein